MHWGQWGGERAWATGRWLAWVGGKRGGGEGGCVFGWGRGDGRYVGVRQSKGWSDTRIVPPRKRWSETTWSASRPAWASVVGGEVGRGPPRQAEAQARPRLSQKGPGVRTAAPQALDPAAAHLHRVKV